MMENWTKKITSKNEDDQKIKQNAINGFVYVEKCHNLKNYL